MDSRRDKEFYLTLVRHATTRANACRLIQGHSDTPLSELGIEQAKALASYFKTVQRTQFVRIYSSDLKRAYDTCRLITCCCDSAAPKSGEPMNGANDGGGYDRCQIIKDARLRERKYGDRFEGKAIEDLQAEAYKVGFNETNFTRYTPEGSESMEDVRGRVANFCHQVLWRECKQGEEVLIVSHWGVIKEFLKLFQPISNGSIQSEQLLETPSTGLNRFKVICAPAERDDRRLVGEQDKVSMIFAEDESWNVRIETICLHKTPHLSSKQRFVNLNQELN